MTRVRFPSPAPDSVCESPVLRGFRVSGGRFPAYRVNIVCLCWPDVRPLTLALLDEVQRAAVRLSPAAEYRVRWLQVDNTPISSMPAINWPLQDWAQCPDEPVSLLLLLAEEPVVPAAPLAGWLRQRVARADQVAAVGGAVFALAAVGALDGHRAALHWRLQDEFAERFPAVDAGVQLYEWDRDRLTGCGALALVDLLLAWLAREQGPELAAAVGDALMHERLRDGSELQRLPLRNRMAASHPRLSQAVALMEAHISEPLTTDEIARQCCVSRRQLERIFKQFLNRVPSQYYLELRLNRARQMLQQSSTSIIQIGLSCGFSSGPHFSSAYRNFFGVTPREDRNQARAMPVTEAPAP